MHETGPADRYLTINRRIQRIGKKLMHERDGDLAGIGLTPEQSAVLLFIHGNPGCNITDLKSHLEVSHQAARALVERMRAKGLVKTFVSERDGRAKTLALTEAGEDLCGEVMLLGSSAGGRALEGLSESELGMLESIVRTIEDNIARHERGDGN